LASVRIDFTSSLYLGFRHGAGELPPWRQLTIGTPSAVNRWPIADQLEVEISGLCGTERALIGRSTLHLFWDLIGAFDPKEWEFIADEHSYPLAQWAMSRLCRQNERPRLFRHLDVDDIARRCAEITRRRKRPAIVTDSFCSVCGQTPDLARYSELAENSGGYVLIDDTQTLGLMGKGRQKKYPWGFGGGGCIRFHGLEHRRVVAISSMAKAFGAALGFAAGPAEIISQMKSLGDTRWHCSQPTIVDMEAARNALCRNSTEGNSLRHRLKLLIDHFAKTARAKFIPILESPHPAQAVLLPSPAHAERCRHYLSRKGIDVVRGRGHLGETRLLFLLTVTHSFNAVSKALAEFAESMSLSEPDHVRR